MNAPGVYLKQYGNSIVFTWSIGQLVSYFQLPVVNCSCPGQLGKPYVPPLIYMYYVYLPDDSRTIARTDRIPKDTFPTDSSPTDTSQTNTLFFFIRTIL